MDVSVRRILDAADDPIGCEFPNPSGGTFISQASDYTSTHRYWGVREEEVLAILDVSGTQNNHLANSLNRDPTVSYFRPRSVPLAMVRSPENRV